MFRYVSYFSSQISNISSERKFVSANFSLHRFPSTNNLLLKADDKNVAVYPLLAYFSALRKKIVL
jgi:hypothetical protein